MNLWLAEKPEGRVNEQFIAIDYGSEPDETFYVEGFQDAKGVIHITDFGRIIESETISKTSEEQHHGRSS
jgi:hypothetical protein